jgi:flagellar L-ring protein precursor FlgH
VSVESKKPSLGIALALLALLGGCATGKKPDPAFAPPRPPEPKPVELNQGAIYQDGFAVRLFENTRARRVGDIITVTLVESTTGTKSASTSSEKKDDITLTNPTLLGSAVEFSYPGDLRKHIPLRNTQTGNLGISATGNSQKFGGTGASAQSNSLSGSITVTVTEVLSNGYLVVKGEKIVSINEGDEFVQLTGIVRPEDIQSDNTVQSTRVANAQIRYGGSGAVADATSHGWLAKFFLAFWPF